MSEWGKAMKPTTGHSQDASKRSWVQEISENPYFLRPEFYPSGRARPETIQRSKVEEELKIENPGWRSVEEGCQTRHQAGTRDSEKQGKIGAQSKKKSAT
jgi:hypothetical protein